MANLITTGKQAQDKILAGVTSLTEATATTLGAKGRNVGIAKVGQDGKIFENIIIHDGVTVTKHVILKDPVENFAASVIKEAAQKQVQEAGDGTTVSIILAHAILTEAYKITATGINPMGLRRSLEEGVKLLLSELDKVSRPIKTLKEKIQVATISAEDIELGKLIAQTIDKMGVDGIVTCEESKSSETTVEVQEGMQLEMGYSNQYYVTNPQTMEATYENVGILVTDKDITSLAGFETLLSQCVEQSKPLLIISPHIGGEAQELLLLNKLQGKLRVLTIRAPSFGDNQKSLLNDIAILTGAKMITSEAGHEFKNVTIADLGFAEYVTANKESSIISGGGGDKQALKDRIESMRVQLDEEEQEFLKEKIKERLAKLTNGVAVIKVGGQTEIEMKERRERALDAIEATKAAIREGIVPGGEVTFMNIKSAFNTLPNDHAKTILTQALEKPFERLVTNAGYDAGQIKERLNTWSDSYGFDVNDGLIKDMINAGIIDPTAVLKGALHNALSVAIQLLTTAVVITPIIEEK